MAGGMQHAGARIGHMGDDGYHAERVHEVNGCLPVALQAEGYDAARTVGQVLRCQIVAIVVGQSAVVYPGNALVLAEEFSHPLSILTMALHAQMKCFQSQVEQEGIMGRRYAAQVAHELSRELSHIGHLAERLRVG